MPLSWQNPKQRRWLMQASLCLVLVGALGVAALVKNHRLQLSRVQLSRPIQAGPLTMRYPAAWELQVSQHGAVIIEPPGESDAQRRVEIQYIPSVGFLSPLELLVRLELLDARDAAMLPTLQAGDTGGLKALRIAGSPGVSISLTRQYLTAPNAPSQHRKQTLACTVLPSGDAIVIRLDGRGRADASDEHFIQSLARSIHLPNQPDVEGNRELALGDEVKVSLPATLSTYAWGDPFRIGRIALAGDAPAWLAVELVPCMAQPAKTDEAAIASFQSLLSVRDPYIRWMRPAKLDDHTWFADRAGDAATTFPARTYLRTSAGGHALLAEFRWIPISNPAQSTDLSPITLWSALASTLQFPDTTDLLRLLQSGAEALRLLPADAVEILNTRPQEQWQWYHERSPKTSLAHFSYDASNLYIGGEAEFDRSPPLASAGWEYRDWRLWRDWGRYVYQVTGSTGGEAFSHETRIEGNQIALKVRRGESTSIGKAERTAIFIPGAVLPLVLGRLPREPMILQTDSLPSPLAASSAGILTLRVEPAADVPKMLPDDNGPMLCWSVRVNGSGQSSRWYFDRDKRLHSISFAAGVHFHRLDSDTPTTRPTRPTTRP